MVWQMYFKKLLSEILTITCRFPNALKLFVSKLVAFDPSFHCQLDLENMS